MGPEELTVSNAHHNPRVTIFLPQFKIRSLCVDKISSVVKSLKFGTEPSQLTTTQNPTIGICETYGHTTNLFALSLLPHDL